MFCGSQQQSSLHTSYAWCNTAPGDLDLCGGALGLNGVEPRTRCNAHFEVTRLDLGGLELSGVRLPTELGQLTALHTLDVSNNQLLGGLPTQLGYLEVLTDLMQLFRDKEKTFCLAVRVLDKVIAQKARAGERKASFVSPDLARRWSSMAKIITRKGEMQARSSAGGSSSTAAAAAKAQERCIAGIVGMLERVDKIE